jgi:hypothetical protein
MEQWLWSKFGRCPIQDTQNQVVASFASVYQFFSPFISATLGFLGSLIIYWIKDRDPTTREFERQTKRLQFWKTFYDLQAVAPLKPNVNHEIRCKQALESAAFWVEAFPTKAAQYSKWLSILSVSLAMSIIYGVILSHLPLAQPGEESGRALLSWILFFGLFWVLYQIVYEALRAEVTRSFLWLARHVRFFGFFGEMAGT